MQAVILYGGTARDPELEAVHDETVAALRAMGWTAETLRLAEMDIRACVGCFGCWLRTPGECVMDDDGRVTARAQVQADARVIITPISFGGYSGLVKRAMDRMVPTISPLFQLIGGEIHHRLRYPDPGSWFAVGWLPKPDPARAALFQRLIARNAINGHSPRHGAVTFSPDDAPDARQRALAALFSSLEGRP
ncbi:MAG TPA: NAD(P)H-dependent oxidoreductase [Armatimonadota bacterium]|nr:NAD(P)H-dependent oxidoreductase [Armatimonadota bacterium]